MGRKKTDKQVYSFTISANVMNKLHMHCEEKKYELNRSEFIEKILKEYLIAQGVNIDNNEAKSE